MIVKNNTQRAYFYEGEAIIPGTNNLAKELNRNHPVVKALLESGKIEIVEGEKFDVSEAVKAINEANNVDAVEAIAKKFDDKKVKAAAAKRKKEIEAAFKQIAEAGNKKDEEEKEEE